MAPEKKRLLEPPQPCSDDSSRRKAFKSLRAMLSDDGQLEVPAAAPTDGVDALEGYSNNGDALDSLQMCARKMIRQLPRAVWAEVSAALLKRGTLRFASGCSGTDVWSECGVVLASLLAEENASNVAIKTLFTCDKD